MILPIRWVPAVLLLCAHAATASPIFNFTPATGMNPQAIAGFQAAANRWSAVFSDNITINIAIDFTALGAGILGQTGTTQDTYTWSNVRSSMTTDATSADDASAVANLQSGTNVGLLINRTSNNPNGSGSATPYLDSTGNNTSLIRMSNANAKALGLLGANNAAQDASITFSSAFTWDFDPSNGISAGAFDFVGVATHEIGHALGYISGVDILDINSPPVGGPFMDNAFQFVSTLDLFRFSALSFAQGTGIIDWTADSRAKYFSINGGLTALATFSTGINFGDGNQASHWKDGLGIGIMDPTASQGELLAISSMDLRALDVIGFNLSVPEPGTLALAGLGLALLAWRRRAR